jgi:hypothetical protein
MIVFGREGSLDVRSESRQLEGREFAAGWEWEGVQSVGDVERGVGMRRVITITHWV